MEVINKQKGYKMSKIIVTNRYSITPSRKDKHDKYQYNQFKVTKRSEFEQCFVAFYEIDPLSFNYPMHYHEANSEAFYIISGRGELHTQDEIKPIKTGDVIVCPPGIEGMHQIKNTSETEKLIYIDFDTTHSPDVIHYPHSNKVGIIIHNKSANFYKKDEEVDYYHDE